LTYIVKMGYNAAYGGEHNNSSVDMPCGGYSGFFLAANRAEDQTGANAQGSVIGQGFAGNFGCGKKHRGIITVTAT
jgi:hypothetical protein